MLRKQSQVVVPLLFAVDLLAVTFSWNLAYYTRFYWLNSSWNFLWFKAPYAVVSPDYAHYLKLSPPLVAVAAVCLIYSQMYHPLKALRSVVDFRLILKANLLIYIVFTALTFYYREFSYSRLQSLYFLFFSVAIMFLARSGTRLFLSYLRRKGRLLRKVLIIGRGENSLKFAEKIHDHKELGLEIAGYISPDKFTRPANIPYLGKYDDIPEVTERLGVEQVYIALDADQQSDMKELSDILAEQVVDLNIVPDIYHSLNINPEVFSLDGMPVITIRQSALEGWSRFVKRAFDMLGSAAAVIMLLPVWIIVPVLIKLTSPGPIFYLQERMGLDGKKFKMIKFRSMKVDAEAQTGAVWAVKDDPRKTAFGSFMRKTSIDELPQFFNVLLGDMSLVGPRPERPVFIDQFKTQIPNYMLRHKIKAGITGWAQVNGWRGNTSLEKRIECDIYYLTHWSIWFDIKILLLTVIHGVVNPNAY